MMSRDCSLASDLVKAEKCSCHHLNLADFDPKKSSNSQNAKVLLNNLNLAHFFTKLEIVCSESCQYIMI